MVFEEPGQITVEVGLQREGYLVLADTWYPGWRASVDGRSVPILRANYAFRAVFVPFWGQERDKKLHHHAHESPRVMTVPLIILAIGAALAGYVGIPRLSLIEHWLEPVFTALFAAVTLRERLSAREWWGGALVLFGIVVSELRIRK